MSVNVPDKMPVPFADAGLKNTIPASSDNVNGLAGYNQGFPPINMTPKTAGGIPPFGQDMNGILFAVTECLRYFQAGSIYAYDSTFSTAVGGYRAGASVLRTDGAGRWLNLTDGNVTDPESAGAAAAGWVPDFTYGITAVTMTNANVTLTPAQYGKPIISITGTLTSNLNLIFPNIADQWTVINSTTGAFTITCKTSAGTGALAPQSGIIQIVGDATNIYSLTPSALGASVVGAFSNLKASSTGLSALVSVTADEIIVESSSNAYQTLRAVSVNPSLAASGANGLDTGTSVASTWYAVFVIWNGTTTAGLLSLSATSPTMPAGYTHKARVGWVRSDATANKYPLSFTQFGKTVRYKVGANVPNLPIIASGVSGNVSTPTFTTLSLVNYIPTSTAGIVLGQLIQTSGSASASASINPNANYGAIASTTNPPACQNIGSSGSSSGIPFRFNLESNNLFWNSNATVFVVTIDGWEDNL